MGIYPPSSWISYTKPNPHARLRLFCFPYAGGGAALYRPWVNELAPEIDVCPVQIPGREHRLAEEPFSQLEPLVERAAQALYGYLDIPFAFFGHSLGALISFELARYCYRQFNIMPAHLFVSAYRAPHLPDTSVQLHQLDDDNFIRELHTYNGTPTAVLEDEEIMQLVLPILRADFSVSETYSYEDDAPLSCPITAFGGLEDVTLDTAMLENWKEQTRSTFKLIILPGDHFFLTPARLQIQQQLMEDLAPHLHPAGISFRG